MFYLSCSCMPPYFPQEDSTSLISAFLLLSSFSVEISFYDRNLVVTSRVTRFKSPFCFLGPHARRRLSSFRKIEHFPKWKFATDRVRRTCRNVDLTPQPLKATIVTRRAALLVYPRVSIVQQIAAIMSRGTRVMITTIFALLF